MTLNNRLQTRIILAASIILLQWSLHAQENSGCAQSGCHAALMEQKLRHKAAIDDCESCHDAGDAAHPEAEGKEFTLSDDIPGLCLICHDDKEQDMKLSSVHSPFEDECLECHQPHASENTSLLVALPPQLCFQCHDDLEEDIVGATLTHPALDLEAKCLSCHSPHATANSSVLKAQPPELCFQCHGNAPPVPMTTADIEDKVRHNKYVHEPAADGDCITCHEPHFAGRHALLTDEFPAGNYAIGKHTSYTLCLDCHGKKLLEAESTGDDTNFRDGKRNLHFVHLNKAKGRSCKNCHDMHGSNSPHQLAETVAFGNWKMPIRFMAKENGGSCLPGCHEQREYTR